MLGFFRPSLSHSPVVEVARINLQALKLNHPMILKPADDKSRRLNLLEDLQQSPMLDFAQKKWLRTELMRQRKGIQGERDSAHYQYFPIQV